MVSGDNMNLTVAMKITSGFSILFCLLIVTSVFSFNNLNAISSSLVEQSEKAIPTLKTSNGLANKLFQTNNITLQAFYQTDTDELSLFKEKYLSIDKAFVTEMENLQLIISDDKKATDNLNQITKIHSRLIKTIEGVFYNRQQTITLTEKLLDQIDIIEEKADDAATLMLDLADHELADTLLQKAVSLGEEIEFYLNSVVSSAFEYRDTLDQQNAHFIENDITNSIIGIKNLTKQINNELVQYNADDTDYISSDLIGALENIETLFTTIIDIKAQQLEAYKLAKENLEQVELNVLSANVVLSTQVKLADEKTNNASLAVKNSITSSRTETWMILSISAIIACLITIVTLRSITRPLARVNKILNIVASGDLSKKLDDSGKDEFALLSNNCNKVIDSLRELIQGIVSRSVQLAAAAEQTSTITLQSTASIEQQRNQVEQAASATTQMSSTSQEVLSSVNDALADIQQADDEAERVKVISEKTKETIELLATEVDSAAHVIEQLQQDSSSIGTILDVIRGIAEQTNLLALNAAIEAARAGEQGRGFSVVADEVRTLASRTQESTQEIQKMIEVLQAGAEKAVSVMDKGKSQATDCVEQSDLANKALDTITHAVHEAYDRSSQIATAANEQSTVAKEISENLESIVGIAEQTTLGAKQTADASSEVARLSEELQNSVQEFKL